MIEIWGRKNAYNVQKVIWTLHELGIEYKHHDVGSTPGDLENKAFLSKNPHARIPVLWDKNEYIYMGVKHNHKVSSMNIWKQ
jgi:glutathione S-transferase